MFRMEMDPLCWRTKCREATLICIGDIFSPLDPKRTLQIVCYNIEMDSYLLLLDLMTWIYAFYSTMHRIVSVSRIPIWLECLMHARAHVLFWPIERWVDRNAWRATYDACEDPCHGLRVSVCMHLRAWAWPHKLSMALASLASLPWQQ